MKNILFSLVFLLIVSCEDNDAVNPELLSTSTNCGITDPVQELGWLKERIEESAESSPDNPCQLYSVIQGIYQGETVFIPVVNGALCDVAAGNPVYNCSGELLFMGDPEEEGKVKDEKVIWKRASI